MDHDDAREFSDSIEQIGEGWFRQLALGIKLRVPEVLGVTRREWSDQIGLKIRTRAERQQIGFELHAEGLSHRAIADVLGVGKDTVNRDLNGANAPSVGAEHEEESDDNGANAPPSDQFSEDENEEDRRLREIHELNEETRQAKLYASLFYMPAREISHMLEDGEKAENVVRIMRRRRYVLKVDVTPMELKKAGEMFLRLAKQETR